MTYKTYTLMAAALLWQAISFASQCDNFYSKVTYSLSHTKKALSATNFEHQMYYAERALIALEKSKSYINECGCAKSEDKTLDVIETLNKAIEPHDWEAGRFFSKKSLRQINELITILDECTIGAPATAVDYEEDVNVEGQQTNIEENSSQPSLEDEMVKVFDKHAKNKLDATRQAIAQLVSLSKSFENSPPQNDDGPDSLRQHQKAYLLEAKQLLEEGLAELDDK